MNELALFAGAGGGILGGSLLGWRTVCAVEKDPYCASVLLQRQNDGVLPPFPIWDDVRTFDGRPWRGIVDVVSGGFPCTDISIAGSGDGIQGKESGLWKEMARIVREVRPRHVFVENSPMLVFRGLDVVLGDLAEMGYDAKWCVLGAADAIWLEGVPAVYHQRDRIWVLATRSDSNGEGKLQQEGSFKYECRWPFYFREKTSREGSDTDSIRQQQCKKNRHHKKENKKQIPWTKTPREDCSNDGKRGWWISEPDVGRMADGVAFGVDRIRALGNGQVPAVVRLAWRLMNL